MRVAGFFFIALVVAGAVLLPAQDPEFILKVTVPLVSVDVSVTDSTGKAVLNLTKDDFSIFEDGAQQQIRNFAAANTPYNALLLLDCSRTTHNQWPFLTAALGRFLDNLRAEDRISLVVFGGQLNVLVDWKREKAVKLDERNMDICNGTDFYGAVDWALTNLEPLKGRKGAIVLTDGLQSDIATRTEMLDDVKLRRIVAPEDDKDFQKVLRNVRQNGAPLYFVAINTDRNPGPDALPSHMPDLRQTRLRMEQLAEASGGRVVFPRKTEDVVPMYEEIGKDLGSSYSLSYAAPKSTEDGRYHRIEVRLSDASLHLRQSRDGYVAIGK